MKGKQREWSEIYKEQVGMCGKDNVMESESGKAWDNADMVTDYGFHFRQA